MFQALRKCRRKRIPCHLDGSAVGQVLAQCARAAFGAAAQHITRQLQSQELLQHEVAVRRGLPEQEAAGGVEPARCLRGQQAAGTQAPQPQRRRGVALQPVAGQDDVIDPGVPARSTEVAGTVTTPEQVDLQHRVPGVGQRAGLQCGHAA